jgi:RHS repeat-associated protein
MSDGSGATAWSYDAAGDIATERRTIAGVTKTISYSYNLDGSLSRLTYPDGRYVNYAYNNTERPTQAVDSGGINFATSGHYAAQGALSSAIHGYVSGGFAGITETWGYNNDLEPTSVVASSSAGTALNLSYSHLNNGSVSGITNGLAGSRNETMTYDPLNRILTTQTAATSGQDCWGLNFGDDALGNLLSMSLSKCSGPSLSVSVSNNKITNTGFSYDAAGNTTADGQYSYAYNAENEIKAGNGVNYTYDGDGLRVEKSSGTLYWRSYTGQVIEETDTSGTMTRDYIFFAARRIAWRDSSGNVYYYFVDAIGSTRAVTNATGTTCFNTDYYPYGQENDYNTSCSPTYKFTGYEFDSETGNYYAYARYYSPRLGRFLSADPHGGDILNPQSLNRYAYVLNNPETFIDPLGLDCTQVGGVMVCETDLYLCELSGACSATGGGGSGGSSGGVEGNPPCTLGTVLGGQGDATMLSHNLDSAAGGCQTPGGGGNGPTQVGSKPQTQTFSACMAANSSTFSLAGLAQGGINAALGAMGRSGVNFENTWWAQLLGGNSISGTLFGSASDAGASAAANTPGLLEAGMGTVTTWGRRTADILSLNLEGRGGLPLALGDASAGVRGFLGTADSVLSLGLDFTTRLEIDAALSAGEAAYCAYKTQ